MDYDERNVEKVLDTRVNTEEAVKSFVESLEPICDDRKEMSYWYHGQQYPIDWSQVRIDKDATPQRPVRFKGNIDDWGHHF